MFRMYNGTLGNFTNNRLESTNQKIKMIVDKRSSLLAFIKSFIIFLSDHDNISSFKTAKQFLKVQIRGFTPESFEGKYNFYLTECFILFIGWVECSFPSTVLIVLHVLYYNHS